VISGNKKYTLLFLIIPTVFWILIVHRYSVNVPWFDDFDPFADFLNQWIANEAWSQRLTLLFQPNNEHRMVFGKLITALLYSLTGTLNFSWLHYIGAAYTLGTLFIIWKIFKKSNWPIHYFLPIPFLLFQLQYYLIFHWAICSHQHQPVVFFVTLSMYLLSTDRFKWAVLAAFCATFAMSSGIFVWLSGLVIIVFRLQWKQAALWLAIALLSVGFYFRGMETMGNEASIEYFIRYPYLSFLGFFAFLGGLFEIYPNHAPIFQRSVTPVVFGSLVTLAILGWIMAILMAWLKKASLRKTIPQWAGKIADNASQKSTQTYFVLGLLAFLLANALVIGLLRPRFGFFVMIVSNYKIYPALFLIVSYITFLIAFPQWHNKGWKATMLIAVSIWVLSIFNYLPDIAERRKYLLINAYNQEKHGYGLGHQPGSPAAAYVDNLMKSLVTQGVYQYPDTYQGITSLMKDAENTVANTFEFKIETTDSNILIREMNVSYDAGYDTGLSVFFRDENNLYLFKMNPEIYTGKLPFRHFDQGFAVNVPVQALPAGSYELGVLHTIKGNLPTAEIIQKIIIPER